MIWDIPSTAFPQQPRGAVVPTSEAFPGLDLKGKKEKKEKEQGGREANSTGKSNNRLGAGCFPNLQRVCPRGFFWGGVKGTVVWGRMVPTLRRPMHREVRHPKYWGPAPPILQGFLLARRIRKEKQFCV